MCDFAKTQSCSKTGLSSQSSLALKLKNWERHKSTSPSHCDMEKGSRLRQVLNVQGAEPVEILPHLYLGSEVNSLQKDVLEHLGITAIMNVSNTIPNYYPDSFKYKCIPVDDTYTADIGRWFGEAAEYIGKDDSQLLCCTYPHPWKSKTRTSEIAFHSIFFFFCGLNIRGSLSVAPSYAFFILKETMGLIAWANTTCIYILTNMF